MSRWLSGHVGYLALMCVSLTAGAVAAQPPGHDPSCRTAPLVEPWTSTAYPCPELMTPVEWMARLDEHWPIGPSHWMTSPWVTQYTVMSELLIPANWALASIPSEEYGGPADQGSELAVPADWSPSRVMSRWHETQPTSKNPATSELVTPPGW